MARRALPPLNGLRAFEAFARLGSMTLAAEELLVTHGAVSRQVRGLETQLGVRLVVGPRHQLALTDAGRRLAGAVGSALDLMAAALPGAAHDQELVVACLGTLAMKWLIPRLSGFLDAHPGLRVRIVESHAPIIFGQDGVQAAIRFEDGGVPAGARTLAFMDHFHGPVLSPALWDEIGRDLDRMWALPRLHPETFRAAWAAWSSRAGISLPPASLERAFEHNSYMLEAAAAGLGAAIAPWAFCADDIARGRLIAPLGFAAVKERYVYVRPRIGENPAAAAFGQWLRQEGERTPRPPPALIERP